MQELEDSNNRNSLDAEQHSQWRGVGNTRMCHWSIGTLLFAELHRMSPRCLQNSYETVPRQSRDHTELMFAVKVARYQSRNFQTRVCDQEWETHKNISFYRKINYNCLNDDGNDDGNEPDSRFWWISINSTVSGNRVCCTESKDVSSTLSQRSCVCWKSGMGPIAHDWLRNVNNSK